MKYVFFITLFIVWAIQASAAELTESQVVAFLDDWVVAQNTGSYPKYASMYSKNFVGIRRSGTATLELDHDAWLEDRKKMFRKKMVVTLSSPTIRISGAIASTRFEQTWESGAYKDKGLKVIDLALENGKMKIVREELLSSKIEVGTNVDPSDILSIYTSTTDRACKKINSHKMVVFWGSENVLECPAIKGWRLYKEYDSEENRSWIRLSYGNEIWSTINLVWGDQSYSFGHFPNVENKFVEWRVTKTGELKALIFRVNAQDSEKASSILTRLFVVGFADKIPRFCGIAKTNAEAREIADKATKCTMELEKSALPKTK